LGGPGRESQTKLQEIEGFSDYTGCGADGELNKVGKELIDGKKLNHKIL
jgi:hypothetical protein